MRLLACDIGSTNLKLQIFNVDTDESLPSPVEKARIITHNQDWLRSDQPLDALSNWLTEISQMIIRDYENEIDAVGFSTYREGVIGLSSSNQVVFAGTNLKPTPLGVIEEVFMMTTFAGWMCWQLTGRCHVTAEQKDAGISYIKRISQTRPQWASLIAAGENIQATDKTSYAVYLGGTDEQLGYVGAGLFDTNGPQLIIATGTFWSTSCIARGSKRPKIRRTKGTSPFLTVDSCVLYKWGPMLKALADDCPSNTTKELVPTRFFGHASSRWFTDGDSSAIIRQAAIDDLRTASEIFSPVPGMRVVVYGGGVRSQYARNLIYEACVGMDIKFMNGDATMLGCAILGRGINSAN